MDSAFPDSFRHGFFVLSHKSWLMRLSIWYLVEIFGSLLCSSLFIAWKYRIGSFKGSEVTRNRCLGQSWLHALRQSRLLLEDSPPDPVASTVMDTLTFALWISAVRRSGCQVLLKGSTGNFCDEQKSCRSRTLAEETFVEHSNPARIALLLSVVLVLLCCYRICLPNPRYVVWSIGR